MAGGVERSDVPGTVTDGELDSLLRAEERLQAALAESEAEAVRMRAEAERAVDAARTEFEQELAEARRALEDRVSADRDVDLDRVLQQHDNEKAALESITYEQIEQLATAVIERLLGNRSAGAGPAVPPT
jgi:F0F1-type ATP synthase membrane subunit b/b'